MLRKDVKAFIKAIRNRDNAAVKKMLSEIPELISATAKSPPKKDDGQSPLQIAFKTGNFVAAGLLLKKGADPNFMEESDVNEWNAPVLHDAIRATIFNCQALGGSGFNTGVRLLKKLLKMGAEPRATDSYGNNCCSHAVLDPRQMIDHPNAHVGTVVKQMKAVFSLLSEYGASFDEETETRESAREALVNFGLEQYNLLPRT